MICVCCFFLTCALSKTERVVYLRPNWPVRPGVRTPGFHPGNRGSIPLRATLKRLFGVFFYAKSLDFTGVLETFVSEKCVARFGLRVVFKKLIFSVL